MKKKNSASNEVTLSNVESRPIEKIIIKKDGKELRIKMNDAELVQEALKTIDEHVKNTGELPQGIRGSFIQWLREANEACKSGESIVSFKKRTITRTIPDYRALKNVTK